MNLKVDNNVSVSNTGINSIEVILRHKPKELFLTGMNFGNFGKGDTLKNLYVDGGYSKLQCKLNNFRMYKKKWNIHIRDETLKFVKIMFDQNKNIKLDKVLEKYFVS